MGQWDTWTYRDLTRFLKSKGFEKVSRGKYPKWSNGERLITIVNNYANEKDIWCRVLFQIIKDSGIPKAERKKV